MRRPARRWLIAAGLVVAVAAAVAVALVVADDDGPSSATTTTTLAPAVQEAVLRADVGLETIEDEDVAPLIQSVCDGEEPEVVATAVVELGTTDPDDLRELVEGVGRGALSLCPEVASEQPNLLNEIYNEALAQLDDEVG